MNKYLLKPPRSPPKKNRGRTTNTFQPKGVVGPPNLNDIIARSCQSFGPPDPWDFWKLTTWYHGNPQPSFLGVISYNPYIGGLNLHFSWFWGPKVVGGCSPPIWKIYSTVKLDHETPRFGVKIIQYLSCLHLSLWLMVHKGIPMKGKKLFSWNYLILGWIISRWNPVEDEVEFLAGFLYYLVAGVFLSCHLVL